MFLGYGWFEVVCGGIGVYVGWCWWCCCVGVVGVYDRATLLACQAKRPSMPGCRTAAHPAGSLLCAAMHTPIPVRLPDCFPQPYAAAAAAAPARPLLFALFLLAHLIRRL